MRGGDGICREVHLVAFSLERKEVMGILFNRRLQQPLEGDNGWAFSILVGGMEASTLSHLSGICHLLVLLTSVIGQPGED